MIKPNKPDSFGGTRDPLAVNAWLYQVSQYLNLVQVGNPDAALDDQTRISFASTFFKGTAASWWFVKVQSQTVPATWAEFEASVRNEFVPMDTLRRYRDKLRELVQHKSVSAYLAEFRNVSLMIPNMTEDEKVDKFCVGLKPQVRLEVLKSGVQTLDEAAKIALNVDSALYGSGMFSFGGSAQPSSSHGGPQPMEIGNLKARNKKEQRETDRAKNACFKCHKVGCRPWKCSKSAKGGGKSVISNNVDVEKTQGEGPSNSEN